MNLKAAVQTEAGSGFFYHPAIAKLLLAGWDIRVEGQSVIARVRRVWASSTHEVWEAGFDHERTAIQLAIVVWSGSPVVDYYAIRVCGRSDVSEALIQPGRTKVEIDWGEGLVDVSFPSDGQHLNSQCSTVIAGHFDFAKEEWVEADIDETSDHMPRDGTQTGGLWAYMGYDFSEHLLKGLELVRQVAPMFRHAGHFMHPVSDANMLDRFVREHEYPDATFGAAYVSKGWIDYPVRYDEQGRPQPIWKSYRTSGEYVPFDDQHLCYRWLAQNLEARPWHPLLRWATAFAHSRVMFQIPGRDKGGFGHRRRGDRGEARPILSLEGFYRVWTQLGDSTRAGEAASRIVDRLKILWADWEPKQKRGAMPLSIFATGSVESPSFAEKLESVCRVTKDGQRYDIEAIHADLAEDMLPSMLDSETRWTVSPNEAGMLFAALKLIDMVVEDAGANIDFVDTMKDWIAEWLYSVCHYSDLPGARGWTIPYWWFINAPNPQPSPSGTYHFAQWACANAPTKQATQKTAGIRESGELIPVRFRGAKL